MARRTAPLLTAALLLVSGAARADVLQQCLESSEAGQKLRDDGKLSQARELFRACSDTKCPGPVRKSCVKWHEQVVESMPSVIIVARDPKDVDVVGAEVVIDGGKSEPVTGRSLSLDPGSHLVMVRARGHADAETRVVVNINEKNRAVKVTLTPASASSTEPVPPAPAAHETKPPRESKPEEPKKETGLHPTPFTYVFGGVAVAGIAGSLVLGLTTRAARDDLPCAADKTCTDADTSGLGTRFLVADVLLGVGIVAAAAAVYTFVTSGSSSTSAMRRPLTSGFTF